eukprot:TRINITY_DN7877_c0_g1_i11.p1 TRINITY_DN7877_c0_g1~~TRINITY_DN7877_c0_g1_i11.p1  ORF type:complete len:666 (-),score=186.46 TRINITY_DN7877_c0_g1_i11:106-2103(-)
MEIVKLLKKKKKKKKKKVLCVDTTAFSKLAAQAAEYYTIAVELMVPLKSQINKRWIPYVELKRDLMRAVAYFQLGREKKESNRYGEELGYYKVAVKYLNTSMQSLSLFPELDIWVKDAQAKILSAHKVAENDNNLIYHERVVPEHKLPPLEKKSMASPLDLTEEQLTLVNDPWVDLLPTHIVKADGVWKEQTAQYIATLSKEVEEQNNAAKSALHLLGLPGALEAMEPHADLPQGLQAKIKNVKSRGGSSWIRIQTQELNKLASSNSVLLEEALNLLEDEEQDDNLMRQQYGLKWTRTPSHALNDSLHAEALKHRANLQHAIKSDSYIQSLVQQNSSGIDALSGDTAWLLSQIPVDNSSQVSASSVNALKQLLQQVDQLVYRRETLFKELKEVIEKSEIVDKILHVQEYEFEKVFSAKLQTFDKSVHDIRATFPPQPPLLLNIKEEFLKLMEVHKSKPVMLERQRKLQELDVVHGNFVQIVEHIDEGLQFYQNFQTLLKNFKSKCADFVFARKTEKHDLLSSIQSKQPIVQTTTTTTPVTPTKPLGVNPFRPTVFYTQLQTPQSLPQQQQPQQHQQPSSHQQLNVQQLQQQQLLQQLQQQQLQSSVAFGGGAPVMFIPAPVHQPQPQPQVGQFQQHHNQRGQPQQQSMFPSNPYGFPYDNPRTGY